MKEFHKPFIKSLVLVAVVAVFAMVSSNYLVNYYSKNHTKTIEYSSSHSQFKAVYDKE